MLGFALLDAWSYLPTMVGAGPGLWVLLALSFFLVAHGWGRLTRVGGLKGYGLFVHPGWGRNLALGLLVGFASKGLGYGVEGALGGFRVEGFIEIGPMAVLLAQAVLGMFLSSATDDVLVRGYLFRHLSPWLSSRALIVVTTAVYVLNHVFYAPMTAQNCALWVLLGATFAYTLAHTGSLWMAIGLHWSGNVAYRMRAGFDPQQGGIVRLVEFPQPEWMNWLGVGAAAVMLLGVLVLVRFAVQAEPEAQRAPAPGGTKTEATLTVAPGA